MTPDQYSLLAHPLTIAIVVIFSSAIGYAVSVLVGLIRDNSTLAKTASDIKELLVTVVEEQREQREKLNTLRSDFDNLHGSHQAFIEYGIHQKKT